MLASRQRQEDDERTHTIINNKNNARRRKKKARGMHADEAKDFIIIVFVAALHYCPHISVVYCQLMTLL